MRRVDTSQFLFEIFTDHDPDKAGLQLLFSLCRPRLQLCSVTFELACQLGEDGHLKASLRAAGKVDVARITSSFGGGGHRNAAGFRMPLSRCFREILGQSL